MLSELLFFVIAGSSSGIVKELLSCSVEAQQILMLLNYELGQCMYVGN